MKILLVEDDDRIVVSLVEALTDQRYAVDVAEDGLLAWDLLKQYSYNLIILDLMLPKLDGMSLCQRIRQIDHTLPILMLTARDSSVNKVEGLDIGADDYVIKPFDLAELLARIRCLFRRSVSQSPQPPILEWGKLQLNPATCSVTYQQQPLTLTPKEYEMMELLLRYSGRILRLDEILNYLWASQATPGRETVKVHILSLRRKLQAAGASHEFIETVYGIGYRLNPHTA